MNTIEQATALLDAPAPPERTSIQYAMAARSTLEKELVRALRDARVIQWACIQEASEANIDPASVQADEIMERAKRRARSK